jgi:serine/threonine-protein kinase
MTTLQPGASFAGNQVVRLIGSGTFGHVYEARRLPVGRRIALKVLHPHLAAHPEAFARFQREGEIVARLEHPHVVTVLDVGVFEGRPFIVMPLLEGETLAQRIARTGAIAPHEALDLFLPVLSAVEMIHSHHVVHRDLKPENIFLDRAMAGQVIPRVLDFGIAKLEEASVALTQTSAQMGSPFYMPPEQVRGALHTDARSDIWSLGVILFEMLTGQRPFTGATVAEVFVAIGRGPTPSVRAWSPTASAGFDEAIASALQKEPSQRWQSARDFATALLPLASESTRSYWESAFRTPLDRTMMDGAPARPPLGLAPTVQNVPSRTNPLAGAPPPPTPAMDSTAFLDQTPMAPSGTLQQTFYSEPTPPPSATPPPAPMRPSRPSAAPSVPAHAAPASPSKSPAATQFMPQGVAGTMLADGPPAPVSAPPSAAAYVPPGFADIVKSVGSTPPHSPSTPGLGPWTPSTAPLVSTARKSRRRWVLAAVVAVLALASTAIVIAVVAADDEPLPPPAPVVIPTNAPP